MALLSQAGRTYDEAVQGARAERQAREAAGPDAQPPLPEYSQMMASLHNVRVTPCHVCQPRWNSSYCMLWEGCSG